MIPPRVKSDEERASSFRVRPARRGDAEAIQRLLGELGYPAGGDAQTVHWVVSHPEIEIFVAADSQDRPIGLVSLSHRPQLRTSGRVATIDELVVTEAWRRRGVGSELIRRALDRLKVLAVKSLELHARNGDPEVIRAFCNRVGLAPSSVSVYGNAG